MHLKGERHEEITVYGYSLAKNHNSVFLPLVVSTFLLGSIKVVLLLLLLQWGYLPVRTFINFHACILLSWRDLAHKHHEKHQFSTDLGWVDDDGKY